MTEFECDSSGCKMSATTHFIYAERRRLVQEGHLCREHGRELLLEHQKLLRPLTAETQCKSEEIFCFDVEFLFVDDGWGERQPLCQIYLVEVNGTRRMGVTTGLCEGAALRLQLQHYQAPRPLTHNGMATLISRLGGQLQHVVIDKYYPDQLMYEAKLHIRQMDNTVVVDVRPSDAIILAVICDVPILVSNEVLAAEADMQQ